MYTIEDLKNGKCAVINDGTLKELQKVLYEAFKVNKIHGTSKFYVKDPYDCVGCRHTDLPKQSVKDFFIETFKQKEMKNSIVFTTKQQRQVYEMACSEWKEKIRGVFSDSLFKDEECEISEQTFKEWIEASTSSQLEVFKKMQPDYFKKVTYKIGDKFKIYGNTYILVYIGENNNVLAINLETGSRINELFKVQNYFNITKEELKKIIGNVDFELLP